MIVIATKRCSKCGGTFALEHFPYSGNGTLRSECKPCQRAAFRSRYKNNESFRSHVLEKARNQKLGQSQKAARRIARIVREYGVDAGFASSLVAVPVCQSCGARLEGCKACVDHCHENSHVRGVVCQLCNIAMAGPADECIARLRGCIVYLERDRDWQSLEVSCPG